ncbi:hypothetical protein [Rhodococcus sp. NPDC058521]|uniref:hypothetical protein n=1 Tax=Rhodococcus sp. NPDC058521 TaxID=3346536 RepID=UPI0036528F30
MPNLSLAMPKRSAHSTLPSGSDDGSNIAGVHVAEANHHQFTAEHGLMQGEYVFGVAVEVQVRVG